MGGLIIRQALQESNLKPLLQNLHVYVSLATPHVGSLFPDSQIVSTGAFPLFVFFLWYCFVSFVGRSTMFRVELNHFRLIF